MWWNLWFAVYFGCAFFILLIALKQKIWISPEGDKAKMAENKHLNIDPETLELLTTATEIKDERLKQYPLKPEANIPVGMINILDDEDK